MTATRRAKSHAVIRAFGAVLPGFASPIRISTPEEAAQVIASLRRRYASALTPSDEARFEKVEAFTSLAREVRLWGGPRASRAAVFAAAATAALQTGNNSWDPHRTAAVVGTNTSALQAAYDIDRCGVTEGWDLIDVFQVPYAIESAVAASIATVANIQGGVEVLTGEGSAGMECLSAALGILGSQARSAVIFGAAEECSNFYCSALQRAGVGNWSYRSVTMPSGTANVEGAVVALLTSGTYSCRNCLRIESFEHIILSSASNFGSPLDDDFFVSTTRVITSGFPSFGDSRQVSIDFGIGDFLGVSPMIALLAAFSVESVGKIGVLVSASGSRCIRAIFEVQH